ncbi:uncharacterized protein LOC110988160 [Acanthaster planci]|uniref:Uncharacterized protein LOC110988160 n=1 Tax=Acanthaster planci TaxID=133434 RepID=A0A8B7ZNF2_ACAPL|nr:uncharacterized protein LOC110988160 [Acanthaster planci]
MSEASDAQISDTDVQCAQGPQQPLSLTARDVSAIVKAGVSEALGSFQSHFDKVIAERKLESEKALQQVQSLKRASELQFRFKGNRTQFEFNEKIAQSIEAAKKLFQENSSAAAQESLTDAVAELRKRNKLIRLADKSEAGWAAVDEYVSDELADDSEDEKRIRSAQSRALAKRKRARASSNPKSAQEKKRLASASPANPDSLFRNYSGQYRSTTRPPYGASFVSAARSSDICFRCGKTGHWRKDCAGIQSSGTKDVSPR